MAASVNVFCMLHSAPPASGCFSIGKPSEKKKTDAIRVCFFGALKGIRTPDLLVRSQTLYPTELSAHASFETVVILALFAVVVNIFINLFFTLCKAKASARAAGCVFFLLHNKFTFSALRPIVFLIQFCYTCEKSMSGFPLFVRKAYWRLRLWSLQA